MFCSLERPFRHSIDFSGVVWGVYHHADQRYLQFAGGIVGVVFPQGSPRTTRHRFRSPSFLISCPSGRHLLFWDFFLSLWASIVSLCNRCRGSPLPGQTHSYHFKKGRTNHLKNVDYEGGLVTVSSFSFAASHHDRCIGGVKASTQAPPYL